MTTVTVLLEEGGGGGCKTTCLVKHNSQIGIPVHYWAGKEAAHLEVDKPHLEVDKPHLDYKQVAYRQ